MALEKKKLEGASSIPKILHQIIEYIPYSSEPPATGASPESAAT